MGVLRVPLWPELAGNRPNDFLENELKKVVNNHSFSLGSDNHSGVCPEIMNYILEANREHAIAYGDDIWTHRATTAIQEFFETGVHVC